MRAFIAIELPKDIRDSLCLLQEAFKQTGSDVKWVEPQNIHLTLKFLGERDEKRIKQIEEVVEEVAKENRAFTMRINSIGAFPRLEAPRVIWVGLGKGEMETVKIAQELDEKIATLGIPKEERPFSSHITIGRVRSPAKREKLIQGLKVLSQETVWKNQEFQAGKITLFKSTLSPKGPFYEVISEAPLIAA